MSVITKGMVDGNLVVSKGFGTIIKFVVANGLVYIRGFVRSLKVKDA